MKLIRVTAVALTSWTVLAGGKLFPVDDDLALFCCGNFTVWVCSEPAATGHITLATAASPIISFLASGIDGGLAFRFSTVLLPATFRHRFPLRFWCVFSVTGMIKEKSAVMQRT